MCGIAGFVGGNWSSERDISATLGRMVASLRHRGPDHSATWTDPDANVAFTHNRLAILDLSPAGNQPMDSSTGRYVIVYNGEIYNHLELRRELAGSGFHHNWRGHSDTETLLAAIESWGTRAALEKARGMFAFAFWDKSTRELTLARDRLGEKPLYYGRQRIDGPFLFGSELKAIAQHDGFSREIDRQALTLLLRYNYIPAPFSIYRGIAKLRPGCFLVLKPGNAEPVIEEYWSAASVAEQGVAHPLQLSEGEATDELERLLRDSIRQQMIADVPIGAFLSGGVDSSAVAALMQELSTRPVKTFTIGFREKGYDEAEHAKAVARHLGTEHTELYVTPDEARAVIPELPHIYDEPFADSSQIPTHLVSSLAREQVTVALSGDGGDELFGGYTRYVLTSELWDRISSIPKPIRAGAARALMMVPPSAWTKLGTAVGGILPQIARLGRLGDRIHKGAPLLRSDNAAELYCGMVSLWRDPASIVIGASEPRSEVTGAAPPLTGLGAIEWMMALDMLGYLPNDILVKVDRAAMAVSLETRVPYLDHRIVEFAWRLPFKFKVKDTQSKWILRQLVYRHVPKHLIERPKMGFGVPIGSWLRGPLREWAEELLNQRRMADEGYFRPGPIRRIWEAHLSGRVDNQHSLWTILMFQSWLRDAADRSSGSLIGTAAEAHGENPERYQRHEVH
jgi:asparagine synthase (glutamine-hydrolysing)